MARDKMIGFRADASLYQGIKAMAARRGMSVSDYARLMCSLELLERLPATPTAVQQDLKETLADMDEFASLEPTEQAAILRRSIEALTRAKQANEEAMKWSVALFSALESYARARLDQPPEEP